MEKLNTNEISKTIQSQETILYLGGQCFIYSGGKYHPVSKDEMHFFIKRAVNGSFSVRVRNEVMASLQAGAFLRSDELNIPRSLINLRNGLLDLNTFVLQPHDKKYHFLTQINSSYSVDANCPKWLAFLNEVFEGDVERINVLQEFFGYCLSPITNMEKSLMLLGEGANGKSVVLNVLRGVFGDENCCSVQMENFNNRNYLAEFFGKMVNISTETNTKTHVYEARFKELVSGEMITADRKYGHPFEFKNTCKLAFAFNELPRIDDKSNAFYRRIVPLPFNVHIPEERQDKNLSQTLLEEKEGILNWAIVGLQRLQAQTMFTQARSVKSMIATYRRENNNVICFVEDRCELCGDTIPKSSVYQAYVAYCKENGFQSQNKINFGKTLRRSFPSITDGRIETGRFWSGVRLKHDDADVIFAD